MKKMTVFTALLTVFMLLCSSCLAGDPFGKYDEPVTVHFIRNTDDGLETNYFSQHPDKTMTNNLWCDLYRDTLNVIVDYDWIVKAGDEYEQNADWNDAVFHLIREPYNKIITTGESHMNSAMVCAIFPTLISELSYAADVLDEAKISEDLRLLAQSMRLYHESVREAFLKDWGNLAFPRRMYFAGKCYGEDQMFLEPQGYTLQMEGIPAERKRRLYEEMKQRVYRGEHLGAREQEKPEFTDDEFDAGSRENGGFWYALNGPVVLGVQTFDPREAARLLHGFTLENHSACFPEYWSGYWSGCDQAESSLLPAEGLPDQSLYYWRQPVICAHPHAWVLYCWYRLKEKENQKAV